MCPSIGHARNKAIPNHPPIFSEIQSAEPGHTGSALCVSERKKKFQETMGTLWGSEVLAKPWLSGCLSLEALAALIFFRSLRTA